MTVQNVMQPDRIKQHAENSHHYSKIYLECIRSYKQGIKLAPGPTGIGKTDGIKKIIEEANYERKHIYCANRVQLVQEMADKLPEGSFVHLRNDLDTINSLLDSNMRVAFDDFLESPLLDLAIRTARLDSGRQRPIPRLLQAIRSLDNLRNIDTYNTDIEDMMRRHAQPIMRFFQNLLSRVHQYCEDNLKLRDDLMAHEVIRSLFPYIEYRYNPNVKILLLTLQKAYHGFFNGKTTLNLSRLQGEDGGYIIFLDEFDFLEHDLLSLITESEQISDAFHFVEQFYRAMVRHKLPLDQYPVSEALRGAADELTISDAIRKRIEEITRRVTDLSDQGIHYPEINQFTTDHTRLRNSSVFQTSRTLTSAPLYLQETTRSFEITSEGSDAKDKRRVSATQLFNTIHTAANEVVLLFKEIETSDHLIYEEMLRHCFQNTTFEEELRRIRQLPPHRRRHNTRLDNLIDTGYYLFEILDLQQETDRAEVGFQHYTMYATPEKIVAGLARQNLVFGLSATADIPRVVRQFDIGWLSRQENIEVIPVNEHDETVIKSLNAIKQEKRQNTISVERASELDSGNPFQALLQQFIKAMASDEGFGQDDRMGYRRKRVELFFATLLHLVASRSEEQLSSDTHLMFYSTFRQIRHLCEHYTGTHAGLFNIVSLSKDKFFPAYEIQIQGASFIVVFYDAQYDRYLRTNTIAADDYHSLFWKDKPVIVISQYPSAGNGVNLQYLPFPDSQEDEKEDFKNIHLLEAPYFYFGHIESEHTATESRAITKRNIWYFAKLFESKLISEAQFIHFLSHIRTSELNDRYRSGDATREDFILNQISTYIQALGRIERVWKQMDDQTVFLCREVYQAFELFATRPIYEALKEKRDPVASNNLREILFQIMEISQKDAKVGTRLRDERLPTRNTQSQQEIRQLLERLICLRQGIGDVKIREEWEQLRRDVLKHDFQSKLLRQNRCVFKSRYVQEGIVNIDTDCNIYPQDFVSKDVRLWDMNLAYAVLRDHQIIRNHFERRGYELSFTHSNGVLLTPYCFQSVLLGAIGEESIRAILQDEHVVLGKISDELFELADLKVSGQPWYIDCKNYNEKTLESFDLSPDDPSWRPKLNDEAFKASAIQKLDAIRNAHKDKDCKLIYLNLVGSPERPRRYFDDEFEPVELFDQAKIIIIQGILAPTDLTQKYNVGFQQFLSHLQKRISTDG